MTDSLRISHALPVARGACDRKPRALPDSLAAIERDDKSVIIDLAGLADPATPVLVDGQVPKGRFDWKRAVSEQAEELFGVNAGPKQELRIRTQIDPKNRAAMTSRLFGVQYTQTHEHDFVAYVDLPVSCDQKSVLGGLEEVLKQGLAGIGRGGAFAAATLEESTWENDAPSGDRVVLVLQTPALLRAPGRTADLLVEYRAAFTELGLPAGWSLTAIFVRERLAGGRFFLNRGSGSGPYMPWLLTEPGATFVFDRADGSSPFPSDWLFSGLKVRQTLLKEYGIPEATTYRRLPFLRENGYGEVVAGFPKDAKDPKGSKDLSHIVHSPSELIAPDKIISASGLPA